MGLQESNSTSSYLYALSSNIFDNSAEDLYFINELQKYIIYHFTPPTPMNIIKETQTQTILDFRFFFSQT